MPQIFAGFFILFLLSVTIAFGVPSGEEFREKHAHGEFLMSDSFTSIGKAELRYNDDNEPTMKFYSNDFSYKFSVTDGSAKSTIELMDKLVFQLYHKNQPYYLSYECTRFLRSVEGKKSYCKTDNSLPMCRAECEIYQGDGIPDKAKYIVEKRIAKDITNENQVL